MSAIGLSKKASDKFKTGLYGNSMTSNPRGLEVANTVLDLMTSEVKNNINLHGYYLKTNFEKMMKDFPFIEKVT